MTRLRATSSPAELDPASRTRELGPGAGRRARDVTALLVAAVGVFADAQTPPPSLFPSLPECRALESVSRPERGPVCAWTWGSLARSLARSREPSNYRGRS